MIDTCNHKNVHYPILTNLHRLWVMSVSVLAHCLFHSSGNIEIKAQDGNIDIKAQDATS